MSHIVKIEKLVYGGKGISRTDQGVFFIPGVLPQEVVEVTPEERKNGFINCRLEKILEQSEMRRQPFCPHFGECGGCDWQYVDYQFQPQLKREILLDCLTRIAKIHSDQDPQIFSASEHGYRIRSQIKIDNTCNAAGFFRKQSNDVVKVDNCPLLSEQINSVLKDLNSGKIETGSNGLKLIEGSSQAVASSPVIPGRTLPETEIRVAESRFVVQGDGFFQCNRYLLEQLGRWANDSIAVDRCMDLYGGCGFFSIMLRDCYKQGLLVENSRFQVEIAKQNFGINGMDNVHAICADVENAQKDSDVNRFKADCIIVDPPRPGLARRAREWISSVSPSVLLYVSCNPSTLARDVNFFVNRCGYGIRKSALFDLYPNSHHLESAILLSKTVESQKSGS